MNFRDIDLTNLFSQIGFDQLESKYDLNQVSQGNLQAEDILTEDPLLFVRDESLVLEGNHCFDRPDQQTYIVIKGDLKVKGVFVATVWDQSSVIIVDGNLECDSLILEQETFLYVTGRTTITGPLVASLGDSSYCRFQGQVTAQAVFWNGKGTLDFVGNDKDHADEIMEFETSEEISGFPEIATIVERLGYSNWRDR